MPRLLVVDVGATAAGSACGGGRQSSATAIYTAIEQDNEASHADDF